MLYRVLKGAFGPEFLAEIERRAEHLPAKAGATVELDPADIRQCELRWFSHGTKEFEWIEGEMFDFLARYDVMDRSRAVLEDVQYTVYRAGGVHQWHIDAYQRPYNQYDTPLGDRFIGKKRLVSLSVLLNDASEWEGGAFEISMFYNGSNTVGTALADFTQAGDAAIFPSGLCHRVAPVTGGVRRSLVGWFCG